MEKRIEQLVKEGFSEADAGIIALAEAKRAEELVKEGFATDKVQARAQREVKFTRLVAEKKRAGLTDEQARSVAEEQIATDARNAAGDETAKPESKADKKLEAKIRAQVESEAREAIEVEGRRRQAAEKELTKAKEELAQLKAAQKQTA